MLKGVLKVLKVLDDICIGGDSAGRRYLDDCAHFLAIERLFGAQSERATARSVINRYAAANGLRPVDVARAIAESIGASLDADVLELVEKAARAVTVGE